MAKHVSLSNTLQVCVLLEQEVEAAGRLETALEDRAVLQVLWVAAPAVKDVMIIPSHGLQDIELGFRICRVRFPKLQVMVHPRFG